MPQAQPQPKKVTLIGREYEFNSHGLQAVIDNTIPRQRVPTGWREITEEKFIYERAVHSTNYYAQGTFYRDENGKSFNEQVIGHYYSVMLFFTYAGDIGYGFGTWSQEPNKLKFFAFGCKHEWETLSWVNFDHHSKCKICGFETHQDSSG